jgi:hypothetical protein
VNIEPFQKYETYWDKLSRISKSPASNLFRTDHQGLHKTVYNLSAGENILRITAETLCAMEVINERNHECFVCRDLKGKSRGLLHAN